MVQLLVMQNKEHKLEQKVRLTLTFHPTHIIIENIDIFSLANM
jgi:hypothetical protein